MGKTTGVKYGTRPLPGGHWGIHVLTYRDGRIETENLNRTPWPTREIALGRAHRAAECEAEREGMKVLGQIGGGR